MSNQKHFKEISSCLDSRESYLTSTFESSEVNNSQTLLVLTVNSCELQHYPHSFVWNGSNCPVNVQIKVSHVNHRNLVESFQSIFGFFFPSHFVPIFHIACSLQYYMLHSTLSRPFGELTSVGLVAMGGTLSFSP